MSQESFKRASRIFMGVSLSVSKELKEISRKCLRYFKEVSCCMAFTAATQVEGVLFYTSLGKTERNLRM